MLELLPLLLWMTCIPFIVFFISCFLFKLLIIVIASFFCLLHYEYLFNLILRHLTSILIDKLCEFLWSHLCNGIFNFLIDLLLFLFSEQLLCYKLSDFSFGDLLALFLELFHLKIHIIVNVFFL